MIYCFQTHSGILLYVLFIFINKYISLEPSTKYKESGGLDRQMIRSIVSPDPVFKYFSLQNRLALKATASRYQGTLVYL